MIALRSAGLGLRRGVHRFAGYELPCRQGGARQPRRRAGEHRHTARRPAARGGHQRSAWHTGGTRPAARASAAVGRRAARVPDRDGRNRSAPIHCFTAVLVTRASSSRCAGEAASRPSPARGGASRSVRRDCIFSMRRPGGESPTRRTAGSRSCGARHVALVCGTRGGSIGKRGKRCPGSRSRSPVRAAAVRPPLPPGR